LTRSILTWTRHSIDASFTGSAPLILAALFIWFFITLQAPPFCPSMSWGQKGGACILPFPDYTHGQLAVLFNQISRGSKLIKKGDDKQ
jgi:hypothetical protein